MVLGNFFMVVASLVAMIIVYYKWKFQYWKRRNLPFLTPSIPLGSISNPFTRREQVGFRAKRSYDAIKAKGWKHGGLYFLTAPSYMVVDLDYIKNVMTKDFQYFTHRGNFFDPKSDPLRAHLFNLEGAKWRNLRTKITPTFTSGKMKMMFQTLMDCVPRLLQKIESELEGPIDIKDVCGCFTTDIIGSCAFGLDCNTFEDENSPFRVYGKKVSSGSRLRILKLLFAANWPTLAKKLGVTITPPDVTEFYMKLVKDTVKYRDSNNITRNDFLQLLLNLRDSGDGLTIEEIAAQSFVFFIAGFETSSTTMAFALYELGRRPDIQEQVRDEVETVLKKHGTMTYEAIQEMKYLDQVLDETLRMYPPFSILSRRCVKDYKIPDDDVVIEKGTSVIIPVLAIHYDQEYYPEPEKFDPERFSEEKKKERHGYAHLPFGEGPRVCIGQRFGLMQTKVGLASLLRQYKFSVDGKTKQPLKMKPNGFILAAEGGIWLNAEKR